MVQVILNGKSIGEVSQVQAKTIVRTIAENSKALRLVSQTETVICFESV